MEVKLTNERVWRTRDELMCMLQAGKVTGEDSSGHVLGLVRSKQLQEMVVWKSGRLNFAAEFHGVRCPCSGGRGKRANMASIKLPHRRH